MRPHRRQPTRLPGPWDSPGKNTGVGCHFLLQCMKVKSEREVAQLCPTLRDPMDCSLPGSSVHGIFQARVLEWSAMPIPPPLGGGVEVRVPRLSLMCPAGVRSPTSGPPGPRGGSPHQNFGEGCCVPRGWSVGDPSASPWEERITRPRVVALPLLHLLEFCCHCPSPHACTPGALCSLGIPRWRSRKESAC